MQNIENIVKEIFGDMKYLTPEENERKKEMYRKISTAIDVSEKKISRGRWIKHPHFDFEGGYSGSDYECSECGYDDVYEEFNFCPNCGASMKN